MAVDLTLSPNKYCVDFIESKAVSVFIPSTKVFICKF
nr:MAG TPA: hypothetical protein [Crassvirales sp.]